MKGQIKSIQKEKGYGFIKIEGDYRKEYFFHRSGVQGLIEDLNPGDRVEFDEVSSPKGLRAENVRLV